jgi:hypothetical protein
MNFFFQVYLRIGVNYLFSRLRKVHTVRASDTRPFRTQAHRRIEAEQRAGGLAEPVQLAGAQQGGDQVRSREQVDWLNQYNSLVLSRVVTR